MKHSLPETLAPLPTPGQSRPAAIGSEVRGALRSSPSWLALAGLLAVLTGCQTLPIRTNEGDATGVHLEAAAVKLATSAEHLEAAVAKIDLNVSAGRDVSGVKTKVGGGGDSVTSWLQTIGLVLLGMSGTHIWDRRRQGPKTSSAGTRASGPEAPITPPRTPALTAAANPKLVTQCHPGSTSPGAREHAPGSLPPAVGV